MSIKLKKPSKVMSWFKSNVPEKLKSLKITPRDRSGWVSRHDYVEEEGDDLALEDTETEEQRRVRRERFEAMYGEKLKGVTDVNQILKILYPDQGAP